MDFPAKRLDRWRIGLDYDAGPGARGGGALFFQRPPPIGRWISTPFCWWAWCISVPPTPPSIDGHVRADFFYGRLSGRPKAWLDIFIDLICIYYTSMLLWEGWGMAWESLVYEEVSSGGVRWPLFPFQALVPLGAFMVSALLVVRIICNIRFLCGKGQPYACGGGGH